MILNINISPEVEARLHAKAVKAGVDIQTFVGKTLEKIAVNPSLEEVLAPLRAEFDASGMTEQELTELLESAKHEMRSAPRSRRAS